MTASLQLLLRAGIVAMLALLATVAPGLAQEALEQEEITLFQSRIRIEPNGDLEVTETIQVRALGVEIRRGIYRDFPLDYRGAWFTRRRVPFEVAEVQRDGKAEHYLTQPQGNGVRVRIGQEDVTIEHGLHTYTLRYRTGRQLGFFADHDELYWNATGNGWSFPILEASALVVLPDSVPADRITTEGYTGPAGSTQRDLRASIDAEGRALFEITRPLLAREGLTVVVGFPKGSVTPPTAAQQRSDLLAANRILIAAVIGLILVLGYYMATWWSVGRDPEPGTVIPQFEPPDGLAPASMRFVRRMGFDRKCFTAALVDMAVKGYATITESKGKFVLERGDADESELSADERQIAKHLLAQRKSFRFEPSASGAKSMTSAISGIKALLRLEHEGRRFHTRRKWSLAGIALSILVLLAVAGIGRTEQFFGFLFITFWLSFWTFGTLGLLVAVRNAWRQFRRRGVGAGARIGSGFALALAAGLAAPFLIGEAFGLIAMSLMTSPWLALLMLLLAVTNFVFFRLLKQPTVDGQSLYDRIDGFRMYLETAEGDELREATPELTPTLFERYLPHAIALDVENRWSEQLATALARSGQQPADQPPTWYHGDSWSRGNYAAWTTAVGGAMTAAIASASTAPGSSSGGGGGGSSGGGGGGGGGGGW